MRFFANLFLVLFAADGAISLLDELASLLFPLPALTDLRDFLATVVIVMAVVVYLSLGIDKRLPKRVFLPLILFVCWGPASAWLFPALSLTRTYGLLAAAGQVLLCLLPVSRFSKPGERSLLMPESIFQAPFFSRRNTLIFGSASLFLMPLVLVLLVFSATNSFLEANASGFMRLAPGGLHMAEKVYRRHDSTIRLAAMIHVAEKQYYQELVDSAAKGRTLVLAEGVSDDQNLLRDKVDYGRVASYLGLVSQQEMHFRGRRIEAAELDKPGSRKRAEGEGFRAGTDILRADLDVSSFRPQTVEFLNVLGTHLKEGSSLTKDLLGLNGLSKKYFAPEMQQVVMNDILHRRNKEVIRHLRKAVNRYDTILIPWGALHMVEIEAEVLRQGFELQQVRERVSIDFKKMIKDKAARGAGR